jgi:hypothetical protein
MTKLGAIAFVAILPALTACSSSCPREDEDARPFNGGNTTADRTYYETNAWAEDFIDFPAGRRLSLIHGLAATPIEVRSYLAFDKDALPKDGRGVVAESAGNQVLIQRVNETSVDVRNDTCEHFYLRLVASTAPDPDGGGGAGGSP